MSRDHDAETEQSAEKWLLVLLLLLEAPSVYKEALASPNFRCPYTGCRKVTCSYSYCSCQFTARVPTSKKKNRKKRNRGQEEEGGGGREEEEEEEEEEKEEERVTHIMSYRQKTR